MLQLNPVQNYLANEIENRFNERFEGTLSIGRLSGFLPLNMSVADITVSHQFAGSPTDTVLYANQVNVSINYRELFSGRLQFDNAEIIEPEITIETNAIGGSSFSYAFREKNVPLDVLDDEKGTGAVNLPRFFLNSLIITDGNARLRGLGNYKNTRLPDDFYVTDLNVSLAAEVTDEIQFLNLYKLGFKAPQLNSESWEIRGQFFADDRFLELNAFQLISNENNLGLTLNFDGVDIRTAGAWNQIKQSLVDANLQVGNLNPADFADIWPFLSKYDEDFLLEVQAEGTFERLDVRQLNFMTEKSQVQLYGEITNILDVNSIGYDSTIDYLNVSQSDLEKVIDDLSDIKFKDWSALTIRGSVNGTSKNLTTSLSISPPNGSIQLNGKFNFSDKIAYDASIRANNVRFSDMPSLEQPRARFTGNMSLKGSGVDIKTADAQIKVSARNTRWDDYSFESANVDVIIKNGFIEPDFSFTHTGGKITGNGWVDLMQDELVAQLSGEITKLNTAYFITADDTPESELNILYGFRLQGNTLDTLFGDLFIDIRESMYRGLEVEDHEIIVTLDAPNAQGRTLAINGTLLEAEIKGALQPTQIFGSIKYWTDEINKLVRERTVYKDFELSQQKMIPADIEQSDENSLNLDIRFRLDDLTILNTFIPDFPLIKTTTNIDLSMSSDRNSIEVKGKIDSDFFEMDGISVDSLNLNFESVLRNDQQFDFFTYHLSSKFRSISYQDITLDNAEIEIDGYDEAFVLEHFRANIGDNVRVGLALSSVFSTYDVDIRIMDFFVGDEDYSWVNLSQTPIIIDRSGHINMNELVFANRDERVIIDGTFSESIEDSVTYQFNDFELATLSDLLDGEVSFKGIMNGSFQTRTLKTDPAFQGDINMVGVEVDDHIVGDIDFNSSFNPDENRFDLDILIYTDPEIYGDLLKRSVDIGKDVSISGYVKQPGNIQEGEALAELNFDFKELDLWVLPYFVDGIFDDMSGLATGNGTFKLFEDDFTYDANFTLNDVASVPVFLNSRLTLNGKVDLNSKDGVVIRDVNVTDEFGGSGILSGSILVGDFKTEMPLDITLSMNNLLFLNNNYIPEIPFYGRVAGTGELRLTGTDRSPFISTSEPINISSNSNISIPIETEGFSDERARFIKFVDSFDEAYAPADSLPGESPEERPELTFMEQFQLDLQFVANNNMNVRLVFDQVTTEVLNARGNGRIRLTLQDEEFRVFGRFDVTGGDYNFVGGDIFSRRFSIREGGSISWEGDPVNARVDVSAAYRARPDISILRPEVGDNLRVPVELILVITGTLESIENDFYFEFPSGVDGSQATTYLALLNSEDQKLLQATSLLFTGNFIALDGDNRDTGNTFQNRAGQIGFGTLLSSQINNLLNSNLSNLDIDLNMTGFDQADLGVALRLFDDRLTLRREGVVTGPDANFGDFDITYRINRYFSLEVFHRRDPLLPGIVSSGQNQFESVNGLGLEARVQYNTWGELRRRIWYPIRQVFSIDANKDDEPDNENENEDEDDDDESEVEI